MRGEHKSPEFMALNPKAKVPVLVVDGEPLTENVAIITYLSQRYPEARLMPQPKDELERLRQLSSTRRTYGIPPGNEASAGKGSRGAGTTRSRRADIQAAFT